MQPGPLALAGGNEFGPGNEPADRLLIEGARRMAPDGHAFVVASAAARQDPDAAVATARTWFGGLGLEIEELPVRSRRDANAARTVEGARSGAFFYLCGGDPGLTVRTLAGTAAWDAILGAWRAGAVLAGSSAGAMALGAWTLIRSRVPGDARRAPRPALGLVPGIAVVPHLETFGHRWLPSARAALPADAVLLGIDERTAAVWTPGEWRARGPGRVVVLRGSRSEEHRDGDAIPGLPRPRMAD